ncbi:MAG: NTP transferase domain-containing protein [Bacteroidales bacterium]
MSVNYIVVQAGGQGTRLGALTRNRPKALVPVDNKPILFHLFSSFPDANFIIVGDYKFDVFRRYLETFAPARYVLVHTTEPGNLSGLPEALDYVPDGAPFLLTWCDLILPGGFTPPVPESGCAVGVSDEFACSWKLQDGVMTKTPATTNGVAGLFVFKDKAALAQAPASGSFAKWLAGSGLPLPSFPLTGVRETGSLEALHLDEEAAARCRPYNHIEFTGEQVVKTALTKDGQTLLDRECVWYRRVSEFGFTAIPRIDSYTPLTMERIHGSNIFRAGLDAAGRKRVLDTLIAAVKNLHAGAAIPANRFDMAEEYFAKTLKRLRSVRHAIPFADRPTIRINGRDCLNVLCAEDEFERRVHALYNDRPFAPIHGDCTLTNTMVDDAGKVYFIDARGYFGKTVIFGDPDYDWAKLYYSVCGNFDQFNVKKFSLTIGEDSVDFAIESAGWEDLTGHLLTQSGADERRIKLIHAIIWLSLASHCWEDFDSLCTAFYNGLALLEDAR